MKAGRFFLQKSLSSCSVALAPSRNTTQTFTFSPKRSSADERLGEKVKVCVVLRDGANATEQELKDFCRKNLPAFMTPDLIEFQESLPKTATGKIIKSQLK